MTIFGQVVNLKKKKKKTNKQTNKLIHFTNNFLRKINIGITTQKSRQVIISMASRPQLAKETAEATPPPPPSLPPLSKEQ